MKAFEYELKMKELDKLKRPYTVKCVISVCFQSSIVDMWKPDAKLDDHLIDSGLDFEPQCPPLDNFAQNNKVQ